MNIGITSPSYQSEESKYLSSLLNILPINFMQPAVGCELQLLGTSLNILDSLDELWANLFGEKLVALVIGVHAIASEHCIREASSARAVSNDDGRL
jgi:hypothetical protein